MSPLHIHPSVRPHTTTTKRIHFNDAPHITKGQFWRALPEARSVVFFSKNYISYKFIKCIINYSLNFIHICKNSFKIFKHIWMGASRFWDRFASGLRSYTRRISITAATPKQKTKYYMYVCTGWAFDGNEIVNMEEGNAKKKGP